MLKIVNSTPILCKCASVRSQTLFETIAIQNSIALHLSYHQARVNRAFRDYFQINFTLHLEPIVKEILQKATLDSGKRYRLKIIYNRFGLAQSIFYIYSKKTINSLLLVEIPHLEYRYKYTNRELFNNLAKKYSIDEFIITQNGYLTDTTIANIALFHPKQQQWHTPSSPLLEGTTRTRLLREQKIVPQPIYYKDLKNYSKIALLNAMVGFDIYQKKG